MYLVLVLILSPLSQQLCHDEVSVPISGAIISLCPVYGCRSVLAPALPTLLGPGHCDLHPEHSLAAWWRLPLLGRLTCTPAGPTPALPESPPLCPAADHWAEPELKSGLWWLPYLPRKASKSPSLLAGRETAVCQVLLIHCPFFP